MGEFDLIRRYFQHPMQRAGVVLGNGDDCALLAPRAGMVLGVSTDMLVEGRHFFADVDPQALGHKALAVNLSDLAAMGAQPLACTLALALPQVDEPWLHRFASGLLALADQHGCALVGGDTTAGPLNLCLTVFGEVPAHQASRRSAAQLGDDIYVSGSLGEARLALEILRGPLASLAPHLAQVRPRLERPTPRIELGLALRGHVHACADVSDGLLGDLTHILDASGLSAELDVGALLASAAVSPVVRALPPAWAWTCVLAGGDDYELVFTAPASAAVAVHRAAALAHTAVTRIGQVTAASAAHPAGTPRVRLVQAQGQPAVPPSGAQLGGFDHFGAVPATIGA